MRKAFTLVELLVVIGIIAVLIAILMPVLSRAREAANQVKCLSNLRTLGMAILGYTIENHGFYPSCGANGPTPADQKTMDWVWWEFNRNPNNFQYAIGAVMPYLGGQKVPAAVLQCPSDDIQSHGGTLWGTCYPYSYSLNAEICRHPPTPTTQFKDMPIRTGQVVAPSRKILAIDESTNTVNDGCWYAEGYTNRVLLDCLSNRHDQAVEDNTNVGPEFSKFERDPGRGNVVYCDGHGEFVPRFDAWDKYHYEPYLNPDADPFLK